MQLQSKYHPKLATPIDRIEFHYSLSKKPTSTSSNAVAVQFPVRLAFSATAHKVQGSNVKKPNPYVVDIRTVMEAAQGYVMLSRIQARSQLTILESVCPKKLYASPIALKELGIMNTLSMNRHHPWKLITSCNIKSLDCHFKDFLLTPMVHKTDLICLQETWITQLPTDTDFVIDGFQRTFNSVGHGKGIVTYYRSGFNLSKDVNCKQYQMSKITSGQYTVINIYRSSNASSDRFINDLQSLLDMSHKTFIVGDFNICFLSEFDHPVIKFIISKGFKQLVSNPTQMEGRLIDHVYYCHANQDMYKERFSVGQTSPYFSDHDILLVIEVTWIWLMAIPN